jgi:hypothetical protein
MEAADNPIVFGAPYSVYVRAVRLALEEKGVPSYLSRSIFLQRQARQPNTRNDTLSAKSRRSSMPDFAFMKRARSPAMWTRHFAVLGSNRTTPMAEPG